MNDIHWECACEDPWYFCRTFVKTIDEHDSKDPYKPFPDKIYLKTAVRTWENEPLLLVPKSRQIMMSWTMVALHLHLAITERAQLIFFQSKKEEDAAKLVDRAFGIFERLPDFVKEKYPVEKKYSYLAFPEHDSRIEGIAQGSHQIRSNVASAILSDEMAFQPEAEDAFVAALPAIEGGGRFVGISSAAPSFFQQLVEDTL